jgi:hypothetical protein
VVENLSSWQNFVNNKKIQVILVYPLKESGKEGTSVLELQEGERVNQTLI